jgi:hypothetical protein
MADILEDEDYLKENVDADETADWEMGDEDNEENEENEEGVGGEEGDEEEGNTQKKAEKKLKQKQKLKELKAKKRRALEDEANLQESTDPRTIQLHPEEMLSLINKNTPSSFLPSLNFGNQFSASNFFHPSLEQATESNTKSFCPFVRALSASLPNYKKIIYDTPANTQDNGAPVLLIVCASAIRATEVIKSISSKLIKVKIAKLFAKHIKIVDQIELLSKDYYPIVIGTPNRLRKLIEIGGLHLNRLQIVLIDYTNDQKHYNLTTLAEVNQDFYELLFGPIYQERDHLKIALIKDISSVGNEEEEEGNKKKKTEKRKHPFPHKKQQQGGGGKNNNQFRKGFTQKKPRKEE